MNTYKMIVVIACLLGASSLADAQDSLSKPSRSHYIRAGVIYDGILPYGNDNISEFFGHGDILPTFNPIASYGVIHSSKASKRCCSFLKSELGLSSYHPTFYSNEGSHVLTGKALFLYANASAQYGFSIAKKWRLGPVCTVRTRVASFVKEADKPALDNFGIYDVNNDKFTSNLKRFDLQFGISLSRKFTPSWFVQADLNYGVLPQVTINGVPKAYDANAQLSLAYQWKSSSRK